VSVADISYIKTKQATNSSQLY